jgi:hypothetical protein
MDPAAASGSAAMNERRCKVFLLEARRRDELDLLRYSIYQAG